MCYDYNTIIIINIPSEYNPMYNVVSMQDDFRTQEILYFHIAEFVFLACISHTYNVYASTYQTFFL